MTGSPAFGCTNTGTDAYCKNVRTVGSSSRGPSEQFIPTADAPSEDSVTAADAASTPRNVRLFSWNDMDTKIGLSHTSFAANTAAFASSRSVIVSISTKSAPAATPISICSR